MRLLIADDNDSKREGAFEAAQRASFPDIVTVETADDAMTQIASSQFYVAVIDLHYTPDDFGEGFGIIEHLRKEQPHCYIICFTSDPHAETGAKAIDCGANEVISTQWAYINSFELLYHKLKALRVLHGLQRDRV